MFYITLFYLFRTNTSYSKCYSKSNYAYLKFYFLDMNIDFKRKKIKKIEMQKGVYLINNET